MTMDFALFHEIPVPRPSGPDRDHFAHRNPVEAAVRDEHGIPARRA